MYFVMGYFVHLHKLFGFTRKNIDFTRLSSLNNKDIGIKQIGDAKAHVWGANATSKNIKRHPWA